MSQNRGSERPLREDLIRALVLEAHGAIRQDGRVADRVVEYLLRRERRLWARERRLVAEAVYGMLRSEIRNDALLRRTLGERYLVLDETARSTLHYEIWRLRDEDWVNEKTLVRRGLSPALLPGVRACLDPEAAEALLPADPVERLSIRRSLPAWIARLFLREVGEEEADALAAVATERAPLILRVNTLRTDRDRLLERLRKEGVEAEPTPHSPLGLRVETRQNLYHLPSFKEGLFEIQDEGSQILSLLVGAAPGWRVVDACAGAGGKTLALAASMENRGRILAFDTDGRRLSQLGPRARRAGIHNWEAHLVPDQGEAEIEGRLRGRADAVLVDAPCSGLGVLRRNPDALHRLDEGALERFPALQKRLLDRYSALVRPGGRLIYGTCSIAREENEEVVEAFLADHPEFELEPPAETLGPKLADALGAARFLRLFPHRQGTDGFFGALLRRKAEAGEDANRE